MGYLSEGRLHSVRTKGRRRSGSAKAHRAPTTRSYPQVPRVVVPPPVPPPGPRAAEEATRDSAPEVI